MENYQPTWLSELDPEDLTFIKKFILTSGSLKKLASDYDVSYPTVRLRLDRLIQKIELSEKDKEDDFINLIKKLTIDDKIEFDVAKIIIDAHKKENEGLK